jgi:hypothetical protein
MRRRLKRKLFLGIAIAAILAGATAAVVMAAQPAGEHHRGAGAHHHKGSGSHHHKDGTLVSAAAYLGMSAAQLRGQLGAGKSLAEVANATSGKSAAGLVAALEASQQQRLAATAAKLQVHVTTEVDRVRGNGGARLVAARYLGLSAAQLGSELSTGKTLAQIAASTAGKSEAGLIEALVTARKATLAAEVKGGAITQARANELLPHLIQRVTKHVNRTPHKPGSDGQTLRHRRSHLSTTAP